MAYRVRALAACIATAICGISLAGCAGIGGNTFEGSAAPSGPAASGPVTPRASGASRPEASPPASRGGLPPNCNASRDGALAVVTPRRYGEHPVGRGVTTAGALLEVVATADGSTWTILVTLPSGPTCLVADGAGWEALATALVGPEA